MIRRLYSIILSVCIIFSFMLMASCAQKSVKPAVVEQKLIEKEERIEIDSDVEENFSQALSYLKSEQYDEAIELLHKVIDIEKRVPAPYVNLAMAYQKKADVVNAEKYFLNAVNIDLVHPVANNQLGLLYRKQGKFDKAYKAYTNALTEYPDYLPVVKNLGILCEIYIRDLACALQQYEHYQSLRPDDKTMKIWIADLSRRVGN